MAQDTKYVSVPYIFRSRGLIAREITDRAPEDTFLNLMNCQVRQEQAMASRYGTEIITRDIVGSGNNNYNFTNSIVSLARLIYNTQKFRYAADSAGNLYRRSGDSQGSYTNIFTGLSGNPFDWCIQSCYETSQPFLFIADSKTSIKDMGTGTPNLWGIDPPSWTANAQPYSPLLTMIDGFASDASYDSAEFDSSDLWGYKGLVTTLTGGSGTIITDFPQFYETGYPIDGGSAVSYNSEYGQNVVTQDFSGFASIPISDGQSVSVVVEVSGESVVAGPGGGGAEAQSYMSFMYSVDGGSTWVTFGSYGLFTYTSAQTNNYGPTTYNLSIPGITNLEHLQFQALAESGIYNEANLVVTTTATFVSIIAGVSDPGIYGDVCNGIVATLNNNGSIAISISEIVSSGLSNGVYTTLTITTQVAHGLTGTVSISVYASSNDLVDGFYTATVTGTTTLTVPYYSTTYIGAIGGTLNGGNTAPAQCVISDEYSTPYPTQFSAWGFDQQVPTSTTSFPVGYWSGMVDTNTTASVVKNLAQVLDLSMNNQVTDADLIVLTLQVGDPANIANIQIAFDVNNSEFTSSYYQANISPAFYQGNVVNQVSSYDATQQQILADTIGLITGQPVGSTTAQLQPSNFSTGRGSWVSVLIPRGNFLPVGNAGQSGLDWTNITAWQILFTTTALPVTGSGSSTVSCNGLYLQWGYGPSSFGGTGYDYRYTYYNSATGTESSPSAEMQFNQQFGYLSSLSAPFYLRQAVQVTGQYSTDPQVTHIRMYRRGGTYPTTWFQIDQIPNLTTGGQFYYKDVIADASLEESQPIILDNDPPVTSSLITPIQTSLSNPTSGGGNSIYSTYQPQLIKVQQSGAVFVVDQTVLVGNSNSLEEVLVTGGGTGQFSAILRLQHNSGEQVIVESIPRQACNLCALAYDQVWLAGDPNNPGYLYFSKPDQPENFGPENYLNVSTPSDPINAVINWRGTLYVGTLTTWYIIQGGANPIAQPTGSQHGIVAQQGWTEVEGVIWYRAADGLRAFNGVDGIYMSLPIEWVYRDNPLTPLPLADNTQAQSDVMCYYNNEVYVSYISTTGQRYRMIYDTVYKRYRIDSLPMTAMLWERDINTFLGSYELSASNYPIVQDQVYSLDYDDGGWSGGSLVVNPITCTIQIPYQDLQKPHYPKSWNVLEIDANTQGQTLNTTLLFDDGEVSLTLPTVSSANRQKLQLPINAGAGQQGYRMSPQHTITVSDAPIFYQEDIYAAELAAYRYSFDTYWILGGTNGHKLTKECLFDYSSTVEMTYNLYADNETVPYFTFTLPAEPDRATIRVRFPALKMRQFRMIGNVNSGNGGFQQWSAPTLRWKQVLEGASYQDMDLGT